MKTTPCQIYLKKDEIETLMALIGHAFTEGWKIKAQLENNGYWLIEIE
jgi:hypothetical protein